MFLAFVVAATVSIIPFPPAVAMAVARNEALYRDIDVSYKAVYRHATARKEIPPGRQGGEVRIVLEKVTTTRVVLQKDLHWVDVTERTDVGEPDPVIRSFGYTFDGEKTRSREGKLSTVANGRDTPNPQAYFPHQWATAPWLENFALSDFLAAGEKWGRVPGRVADFKVSTLSSTFCGIATVGGERCVVIRCDLSPPKGKGESRVYSLAVGKNYLPVKTEKYAGFYSETLPIETVECGEFKELKPGLWLPYRVTRTVFNERELKQNGKSIVSNTTETTVVKAVLGPKLARDFFRELASEK